MKKYLLILLLISFAATEMSLSVQSSFAAISSWSPSAKYAADSAIVISPITDLDSGSHGPRAPMIVPISASYERLISSVILAFNSNLGEIEVEVVNTTTGGYDAGTIDTQLLYYDRHAASLRDCPYYYGAWSLPHNFHPTVWTTIQGRI